MTYAYCPGYSYRGPHIEKKNKKKNVADAQITSMSSQSIKQNVPEKLFFFCVIFSSNELITCQRQRQHRAIEEEEREQKKMSFHLEFNEI